MTRQEVVKNWVENIASDDEILDTISAVNSYDGRLENFRYYRMEELNELFCDVKPLDLLDKLAKDFDSTQELFRDDVYGLESCSMVDAITEIKSNSDEIVDAIVETMEKDSAYMYIPDSLEELL